MARNRWHIFAEKFSDKLMDIANLTAGGLVIGQFISGQPFQIRLAVAGVIVWVALYGGAYLVLQLPGGD